MVLAEHDALTGMDRDSVAISAVDAERLGVRDGDPVVVRSAHGELRGRAHVAPLAPGNVQVLFPEGNVLLSLGPRDSVSGVPDYTTTVEVAPAS
jgi:anaerobic selenocysteine-containing dehydrogenase